MAENAAIVVSLFAVGAIIFLWSELRSSSVKVNGMSVYHTRYTSTQVLIMRIPHCLVLIARVFFHDTTGIAIQGKVVELGVMANVCLCLYSDVTLVQRKPY